MLRCEMLSALSIFQLQQLIESGITRVLEIDESSSQNVIRSIQDTIVRQTHLALRYRAAANGGPMRQWDRALCQPGICSISGFVEYVY